ncbi:hypothetical protein BU26DRAFT_428431 [Trematosphaeria pertusa]|uniref:DUF3176 domain containing protein n=1 Tax=Trematosphaeria pertusa TaxID=390896 RepID=A0A6A6IBS0_9PLEO|nr:uncharacterized protein BU26DRAFT_428431 [Trematosphaeria pertusa]KAF2248015.1 hypothetical protein BU26DRAFT_428431 [Trematosphaeria pertusa]
MSTRARVAKDPSTHLEALQEDEAPPSYPASQQEKSKLDIPQRLERRLARLNTSDNLFKRWAVEGISWTVSAISMGAIIAILVYIKDQRLSKWPLGLTAITVLSKLAAATLIIPTSEAIGQLKWNWFHGTSKEMFDFEIFDKASRGPWGSVMLLLRTKGRSLAALGAILTLLMLAIDTFFQQVVDLPERWILQGPSSITRVVWYQPRLTNLYRAGVNMVQDDQDLLPITQQFFYDNGTHPIASGNGSRADVPTSCPTSNCTWPPYQTLGICSACEDVSSILTHACLASTIDWTANLTGTGTESTYPNGTMCGYFINATSDHLVFMSGYNTDSNVLYAGEALLMRALPLVTNPDKRPLFGGSIHFKNIRNPISDFIIVSAPGGPESVYRNETPVAKECVVSWCVKTLKSSYFWGSYEEEVIDTFLNTTALGAPFPWVTSLYESPELHGTDITYLENVTIDVSSLHYGTSNESHSHVISLFDDFLPSFTTVANTSAEQLTRFRFYSAKNFRRILDVNPWLPPNNITHHMERLATAMTNVIRSSTSSNKEVFGDAYGIEVYVKVQWAWLAFPLALLLLSAIFLVATMVKSARDRGEVGVWKTSAMPTLIYSLPKDLQGTFSSNTSTWTTAGRAGAQKTRIKLLPSKGWRVSGHQSAPTTPVLRTNQAPPAWI